MILFRHVFSMAMISLIVLVVQNSLLVVMTRFSRKNVDAEHNYHTSTLVLNQECVKMLMCLVIYAFDDVWKQFSRDESTTLAPSTAPHAAGTTTTMVTVVVDGEEQEAGRGEDASGEADVAERKKLLLPEALRNATTTTTTAAGADVPVSMDSSDTHLGRRSNPPALVAEAVRRSSVEDAHRDGPDEHSVAARDGTTTAAAAATSSANAITNRRAAYATSVPPPPGSASSLAKAVDSAVPRRFKPQLAWLRTRAAVKLYCSMLRTAIVKRDTLKLLVPAFLFNLQNFLIFVGLSNLDAVSFQVWSQTKLLSTALFSVWLLHRRLSLMQWLSLVALTAGVLGAQLGSPRASVAAASVTLSTMAPAARRGKAGKQIGRVVQALANNAAAGADGDEESQANAMFGIAACVISGLSSSYAGVYFEKVVKTTSPTLSIRNIQLSVFGIPFAFVSMLLLDVIPRWYAQQQCGDPVHWNIFANPFTGANAAVSYGANGACPVRPFYFWQRYDQWLTWGLVGIHAFGGLLVAIVVKYADNILKGFATGVAVIVSGMMSSVIWGYKPTVAFVLGAFLVIGSSIAFHKFEPKR